MTINDVLPLKTARRDAIAKLKCSWGFESELHTNPMPFYLDSPWGATLIPLRACAMDLAWNKYWGSVKKLRTSVNPFVDQVYERFGKCRRPLYYFPMPLSDCLHHVSFRKYSPFSLKVILALIVTGRKTSTFLRQIASAIYCLPFGNV